MSANLNEKVKKSLTQGEVRKGNFNFSDEAIALYVHWPFCVSKCPYCDFNSHVRETIDMDVWRAALLSDMAYEAELTKGKRLTSIFFGGGTPSLMPPALVEALLRAAHDHWGFDPSIEITLEANPNSVEVERFADLARAGVNRVSIGVQSFEADALAFLGRAHNVGEAHKAIDTAQAHFNRVSFDLVYALPDQSPHQWETQLTHALSLGTGHLSLYQLTIEPGTRFETLVRQGDFTPLDNDQAAELYELTQAITGAAGIPAYEISNHARPGEESRHNMTYWRYGDYAGIGPGAHGRRMAAATQRHRKPENWLAAIGRNGHGCQSETPLSAPERASEALMMGLRLAEGININTLSDRLDIAPRDMIDEAAVMRLSGHGLIERANGHLRITPPGMLLLDAILPQIMI
ncbi:MAG: radical SAM family heme chaperone HemW [Sphingobium sp.]|nr:coproporphyrinogen III oxidase [Sphingobium sp.]MCP5400182.1 coproporphyrinogen III oxidase [Sphingomonas sp.]